MSTFTLLWCAMHLIPLARQGVTLELVWAIALCLLVPGDMVLAHWQHRYPWWAIWVKR